MRCLCFTAHARGLVLTEQGDILYRAAREILQKLNIAEARISESRERPKGPLKITTTIAFGSIWLAPRLKEFLEDYPDIDVSLMLSDNELDLSMREADLAIRMMPPTQSDLVQRRLMTLHYHLFAAPVYLEKHGTPEKPEDLEDHRLIVFGEEFRPPVPTLNWLLEVGTRGDDKRKAFLRVNSTYAIFRAVQSGIGIGALPHYLSQETTNLVPILPELEGPDVDVYFVYPEGNAALQPYRSISRVHCPQGRRTGGIAAAPLPRPQSTSLSFPSKVIWRNLSGMHVAHRRAAVFGLAVWSACSYRECVGAALQH